ncbi:hypothetical protein CIC12_23715 [Burkholderia sp. SG-MS1]|nr:hypothetical protein [Paraburkholderia sp. SG-MS1]
MCWVIHRRAWAFVGCKPTDQRPRNPAPRERAHGIAVQSTRYGKAGDGGRQVAWHLHLHVQILFNRA